jgi:hypothetical protein
MPFTQKQLDTLKLYFEKTSSVESKKHGVWLDDLETYTMSLFEKVIEMNEKKSKREKKPKNEDPDRVKRPVPASWMFRDENREQIVSDHFDGEKVKGSTLAKKAMEVWNDMSEEAREPWVTKRQVLWDAYKAENPSATASSPKSAFSIDMNPDDVEVPDGWNGPHTGKFLRGYAVGCGRGVGKFATFDEAYEAAKDLSECGGITYDEKSGYSLRRACDPEQIMPGKVHQISWAKENHTVTSGVKKTRAKKVKKISVEDDVASNQETLLFGDEDVEDGRVTPEIARCNDEEQEAVYMDETDGEEEEMEVTPWDYKGTTYLLDEKTGDVYDYDEQELVGKKSKGGKLIKIKSSN